MSACVDRASFDKTPILEEVTVKFDDARASATLVQSINVLRNQGQSINAFGELSKRNMPGVRARLRDQLSAPSVPAPDELRVAQECFGRRKIRGVILLPEPGLRFPKCRYAALGGYPGACEHADMLRLSQCVRDGIHISSHSEFCLGGELPQHVMQNAAVFEVIAFLRCIDADIRLERD